MDLTATIVPKSDQLNAEDMLAGALTVTVESVSAGSAEQPVDFHLTEYPGRAYRPSKTMRRIIVKAWGKESDAYTGRRMTLYRDPDVKFGGQKVGGIKISHLSHIDKAFSLALSETRGKRAVHTVEPLPNTAPAQATPTVRREQVDRLRRALATLEVTPAAAPSLVSEVIERQVKDLRELSPDELDTAADALERMATHQDGAA